MRATTAAVLGSAQLVRAALPALDASSALGLDVARWAGRPARLARMDRLCAMALVACDGALLDAGLSPEAEAWSPLRTGVVLGTAYGCHATNEAYYRGYLDAGLEGASPRLFAYTLPSSPVGEIAIHHRIHGPASTTVGGLTSAIDAVREALRHLDAGRADRVIVGGADVSTPLLGRLTGDAGGDAAAAIVLGRGEGGTRITGATSTFSADDPREAALATAWKLLGDRRGGTVARIVAPATLVAELRALFPEAHVTALDASAMSAGPLFALRTIVAERATSALVIATDPVGQASALFLERAST